MRRSALRDIVTTVLFGLVAPTLWGSLLGLFGAFVELPLLAHLSRQFRPLSKSFVHGYMFSFEVLAALVCGCLIALPLGYLLRKYPFRHWLLFAILFLAGFFLPDLFESDSSFAWWGLTLPSLWLFLVASVLFTLLGHRLRTRREVA